MHARKQYLYEVRKEYAEADEPGRSRLLDEAQKRTGMNRKYLIRLFNRRARPRAVGKRRRKRQAEYGAALTTALIQMWDIFEQPCGQRLAPALRSEVDRLRRLGKLRCSDAAGEQLKEISPSTIDRLLRREKQVRMLRRNRNPNVQRLIYEKVPVKVAAEWDTEEIGNLQVDFVLHCGRSTGEDYISTISAVDIATNWWEGQAITVRSQHATKEALEQMLPRFPFRIREVHPDNDSALINDLLWDWCRQHRIRLSRSRPYKKNDNAWNRTEELDPRTKDCGVSALRHPSRVARPERDLCGAAAVQELLSADDQVEEQDARERPDQAGLRRSADSLRARDGDLGRSSGKPNGSSGRSTKRSIPPSYTGGSQTFASNWR